MKATYAAYDEILKRKKHYMKGKIENRFSCDLKHVSLERPYDLVIARWCLGYLNNEEVVAFLTRCNKKLIEGRESNQPGIIILQEQIMDKGEKCRIEGLQKMHLRTEAWYNDTFMGCRFSVKMTKTFSYGPDIYPVMMFCLVPYPEDSISAFIASSK